MAEIKKELLSEKKDDDALEKTVEEINEFARKTLFRTSPMIGLKTLIENLTPNERSLLTSILNILSKLGKSMEDSSQVTIRLTAQIKALTWVLVILGIAGIALAILSLWLR